jgi:hypothetical protein
MEAGKRCSCGYLLQTVLVVVHSLQVTGYNVLSDVPELVLAYVYVHIYINDLNTFSSDLIPFCCSVFSFVPFFTAVLPIT